MLENNRASERCRSAAAIMHTNREMPLTRTLERGREHALVHGEENFNGDAASISIVIPTFRRQQLLASLLELLGTELIARSRSEVIEILVIDNCPDGSARRAVDGAHRLVRYIHEPRTGVANARNRGVAEARGAYVLFIDDDELPHPGWLDAFILQARGGVDACFGPVEPLFELEAHSDLKPILERIFSRRIPAATGDDISGWRAYLGTGNSLFRVSRCFTNVGPFNVSFNGGGEDVWLLRHLVDDRGVRLRWSNEARVAEIVPPARMTHRFVFRRRFHDGQIRCRVEASGGGSRAVCRVAFWMLIGCAQVAGFGLGAVLLLPFDRARATTFGVRVAGGLGKLLWWRDKQSRS